MREEVTLKKFLIYLVSFILICFILPAILTRKTITTVSQENSSSENQQSTESTSKQDNVQVEKNNYEYNKYGTITLLHKKIGETEQVNLDDYLCNVVSAEMPADYEIEALKA